MPASSTTAPGNVLAASSTILAQGVLLNPSRVFAEPYSPVQTTVNGKILIPSTNLPTITIYLKLAAEYFNPNTQTYVYPSLNNWFTPLVQIGATPSAGALGIPLCAPILLPVERAVFYTVRGSYTNVGFNVDFETNGGTNASYIDYIISASQ
jgi:hypothetical protein